MSDTHMSTPMKINGKHVLLMLLAFFGIVIAVNVTFVFVALDTWTGLTSHKSYQEGLTYNAAIRDAEAQRARGWQVEIEFLRDQTPPGIITMSVSARLADNAGKALMPDSITLAFRHPINETYDQLVTLSETTNGLYVGQATLPVTGNWDTRLTAEMADGTPFRQDGTLWIE
ncbi:FixH family protein [Nisaea sp.]|uniref:FixH family protein n=1 Tax=Nisaea sp. TaxID=2024842 RepID=UPI0032990E65